MQNSVALVDEFLAGFTLGLVGISTNLGQMREFQIMRFYGQFEHSKFMSTNMNNLLQLEVKYLAASECEFFLQPSVRENVLLQKQWETVHARLLDEVASIDPLRSTKMLHGQFYAIREGAYKIRESWECEVKLFEAHTQEAVALLQKELVTAAFGLRSVCLENFRQSALSIAAQPGLTDALAYDM